jgi:adenine-specific DNA-methyltransferase
MVSEKLDLKSPDLVNDNFEKLAALFPNCVTESAEGKAIDFDLLKQELSHAVVEGNKERYRLEWPGKREAIVTANLPTTKTLRPVREDSVDFDNTENLYIEGDNLEVLKLLQESYLGKIKMIYIDPPYNTGNDFVYVDDFKKRAKDSDLESGLIDEEGKKLAGLKDNPATASRYHSDWLTMMYPRLKLARNLLTQDGVLFISIDDNEVHNLKKICDEVFGEPNFVGIVSWLKKRKGSFLSKKIVSISEYCLVYGKSVDVKLFGGKPDSSESQPLIKRTNPQGTLKFPANSVTTKLSDGTYESGRYGEGSSSVELLNDIVIKDGKIQTEFSLKGPFIWGQENLNKELQNGARAIINTMNFQVRVFKSEDPNSFKGMLSSINGVEISGTNEDGYEQLRDLLGAEKIMDYPKPINYLKQFISSQSYFDKDAIVLDFFSGSASTAHAVMEMNAKEGSSLKFIQVQLPEETDEKSPAYKNGYKNICEIGKERIRRAAKKSKKKPTLI